MEILFGPAHDARHIDPDAPNGYEWWYFDAISDDGKYTLVVIFFLGTPMSPYYKSVVDGKNPLPRDWCGVFVSLHERKIGKPWHERAYTYNLYRGGDFDAAAPSARVGGSQMQSELIGGQWHWHLTLDEPGLWRGRTKAEITFTLLGEPLALSPVAESEPVTDHHWACVAPRCRVKGVVTTASGEAVAFDGTGYHDHNFGMLPWHDAAFWFWSRVHVDSGPIVVTVVFYRTIPIVQGAEDQSTVLFFDSAGQLLANSLGSITPLSIEKNAYGFRHESRWRWQVADGREGTINLLPDNGGVISEGPFYRRIRSCLTEDDAAGSHYQAIGIGEVFQPSRLCGPIASRAMWTRMRRRS